MAARLGMRPASILARSITEPRQRPQLSSPCSADGSATLDAGQLIALCDTELNGGSCSMADRTSFGVAANAVSECVNHLQTCSPPSEPSWNAAQSACFAELHSVDAGSISGACEQALYIAGL